MNVTITAGNTKEATITIPASKSISHRALIAAGLSQQQTVVEKLVENQDTDATISSMQHLGTSFTKQDNQLIVSGIQPTSDTEIVDCNESGSTLRFMIPLFSVLKENASFTGHGRLMERPQNVYEELFHSQGLSFGKEDDVLKIGGKLKPGKYQVKGDVSSQFITGLLFALPLLDGDSELEVIPPYESRSYVRLTLDVLNKSGIDVKEEGNTYYIKGNQSYELSHIVVPGDDSQAAFFAALGMILGKTIQVLNVDHNSLQGDHVFVEILQNMGGDIQPCDDGYICKKSDLSGITIDLADCPDLGPILFALATQAEGTTTFINAGRLRVKESDRIACMESELTKLGCDIHTEGDTVYVKGKCDIQGNVTLRGHNDHRIVMALSVLSTIADGPVTIEGAQAINKSYPTFFEDLAKTGVSITYDY